MLTIYVQNKPLFLISKVNKEVESFILRPDTIFFDDLNSSSVKNILQQLEGNYFNAGVFLHPRLDEMVSFFKSYFTLIIAAGGLVYTEDNEILLIFRKGKWDLPKGKLDDGEKLEACALREIEEETGAANLSIQAPLYVTYHTYYEKDVHILKESHWFLIKANKKLELIPQTEEDILECRWVRLEDLGVHVDNAHASIIDVINAAQERLTTKNP